MRYINTITIKTTKNMRTAISYYYDDDRLTGTTLVIIH